MASYRADEVELRIDPELWTGVKQLAAAHNATVSMVLQAAMATVLHRAGAGEDVVIGTPTAGRSDQALDDLVGFFVNTWVLRTGIKSGQRFSDVLAEVRQRDFEVIDPVAVIRVEAVARCEVEPRILSPLPLLMPLDSARFGFDPGQRFCRRPPTEWLHEV